MQKGIGSAVLGLLSVLQAVKVLLDANRLRGTTVTACHDGSTDGNFMYH